MQIMTYKHGGFHRPPLEQHHGSLTHPVQSASDPAQGEQYVQGLAVVSKRRIIPRGEGRFTIANTIRVSSHPNALTILSRTKHRKQTAIKEMPKKTVVTTKIAWLRPSKGNIMTD